MLKKLFATATIAASLALGLAGCNDADTVSRNLSTDADNFKIPRRVVFYNGITGEVMLEIKGLCSIGNHDKDREVTVVCKKEDGTFVKEFLGLSDNVTYFAEQLNPTVVSNSMFRVTFKPSMIIPEVEIR